MEKTERKKHGKVKKILLIFIAVILILCIAVFAVCIIPCKTHNIPIEVFNSDNEITVTEIDGVLTGDLYSGCLKYLPDDFYEYVIPGGNHAGFAYYGPQAGDNEATISKDEQIEATAKFLAEQIKAEN